MTGKHRTLSAIAFCIATILISSYVQAQPDSWVRSSNLPDTSDAVVGHFVGLAQGYAGSRGYRISDVSQRELFSRLSMHVDELKNDRSRQLEAQVILMRFVDAMINSSHEAPGQLFLPDTYRVLGEQTFSSAEHSLCPIWPIC